MISKKRNRFESIVLEDLSETERETLVALAVKVQKEKLNIGKGKLKGVDDTITFLQLRLGSRKNEVFGVIYLDARNTILGVTDLFHGTVTGAEVHIRPIIQEALSLNACRIILYHNHPSGDLVFSDKDLEMTMKVRMFLQQLDIDVVDHFLVSAKGGVSLMSIASEMFGK